MRQVRLNSLVMDRVILQLGTFRPRFDHLVNHIDRLVYLHFDNLWEQDLLHFEGPGKPHFKSIGRRVGPMELTRVGTAT